MSDLHILFPAAQKVKLGRRSITIHPVKLRHLAEFSGQAGNLLGLMADSSAANFAAYGAKHSTALRRLLLHHTSLNRWQVWRLDSTSAVLLACHVVRANFDFFAQAQQAAVASLSAGAA